MALHWGRRRRQCLLGAAVAAASLLFSVGAFAAQAGGFSVRPAHVDPADPATRAYFKPVVAGGGSFSDQVVVANSSDAPIDLLVSAVDGLTGQTSGAVYANRQDPVAKAGQWVTPAVSTITLPPHSERTAGFSVHVPTGALPGDHLAGIAFEDAHPRSSGAGFSVTQVLRAVVGVQVQVPGPAQFHVHIDGVELKPLAGPGTTSVVVHLGDDGLKLGKAQLAVSLAGPHGYRRSANRQLDTLLPADTIAFPLPWPDTLAPGDYRVVVTATGGSEPVTFRTIVHLGTRLPGGRAQPRSTARGISWWLFPLVGLGGVLAGVAMTRRPRRAQRLHGASRGVAP